MLKVSKAVRTENSQELYDIVVINHDQRPYDGQVYVGTDVLEFEIPELGIFVCGQPSVGMTDSVDLEYIQMALDEMCR